MNDKISKSRAAWWRCLEYLSLMFVLWLFVSLGDIDRPESVVAFVFAFSGGRAVMLGIESLIRFMDE